MKIKQLYTPKDFHSMDRPQFFDLWFRQALTEKQIAKLFGVDVKEVKEKRKNFNMGWLNSGIEWVSGKSVYRMGSPKLIEVKAPKNWDGNPLPFPKMGKRGKYVLPGGYDRDKHVDLAEELGIDKGDIEHEKESTSDEYDRYVEAAKEKMREIEKTLRAQPIGEDEVEIDIEDTHSDDEQSNDESIIVYEMYLGVPGAQDDTLIIGDQEYNGLEILLDIDIVDVGELNSTKINVEIEIDNKLY